MSDWIIYWRAVVVRAWRESRKAVFPNTKMKIVRDLLVFIVFLIIAYVAQQPLAATGVITRVENPAIDNLLPVAFAVGAILICFSLYFVFEVLLIAPYRIHAELVCVPPSKAGPDQLPSVFNARAVRYRIWDSIDPLELYQVACLWIDLAPPDSSAVELTGDASASLYRLERALEAGELEYTTAHLSPMEKAGIDMQYVASRRFKATKSTRLTRAALKRYAESVGEEPMFLYPKQRTYAWMR